MLKYALLLCYLLMVFCGFGQTKIIYRSDNQTLVFDIQSEERVIVDTTLWDNEKLLSVRVQYDSVECFYSRNGLSFTRKYDISKIKPLDKKVDSRFEHKINPNSYYYHNFFPKDYRLILFSSNGISLLKGDSLLWDGFRNYKFNKSMDENYPPNVQTGFKYPILSPDGKHFLITGYRYNFLTPWVKLYEVKMDSGEIRLMRKNAYNPSYSANGQYILFSNYPQGLYYIIDRSTKKKLFSYGFKDAFWLNL